MKRVIVLTVCIIICSFSAFSQVKGIKTGAEQTEQYLSLIKGKSIAVVANQTSMVGKVHLVDSLLSLGVDVKVIFAPEHGFRDLADDGAQIKGGTDPVTGITVKSLYGAKKYKPAPEDLEGVDIVLYDIQDVGTRFYTYISTMHYVMEACAENNIDIIILDRPNPNGYFTDGPMPDKDVRSFVCIDPIPVVHGMTVGELAGMMNGEGWLKGSVKCDLKVIKCLNYKRSDLYILPVKPSPNLPNMNSVYLYPSLCFSEGTLLSCGRGTEWPFQVIGAPLMPDNGFYFTPATMPGATNPRFKGIRCNGIDYRDALAKGEVPLTCLDLQWLIDVYNNYPEKDKFFNSYFDTLAGGPGLRKQIEAGMSMKDIRKSWKPGIRKFKEERKEYLLYN